MSYQLLCCGDANALKTWSNIPYFLLKTGIQQDVFESGISLHPDRLNIYKPFWNIVQYLRFGYVGGFQYSRFFLERLWSQYLNSIDLAHQPLKLLSHFPLLPCHPWPPAWRVSFYIDATTKQVFEDYRAGTRISPRYQAQIIQREAASYHSAEFVITMSTWAAESVHADYGVPSSRIHVVPGGANLDVSGIVSNLPSSLPPPPSHLNPLRLGFLGKEWLRKGGPFVLKVAEKLDILGIPAVVRAIGPETSALPNSKHLQPLGFIDKSSMQAQFVKELRSWHFGTLFSSVEAFGISNRECSLLGVPVLAYPVGGIPSTFSLSECGNLFPVDSSPESVASWIAVRIEDYDRYLADRSHLLKMSDMFSWKHTTAQIKKILT